MLMNVKGLGVWISYGVKLTNTNGTYSVDQTLSIWLGIQFRQRNNQIKDRKPTFFWNIFGLA